MFICSLKASKIKFILSALVCAAIAFTVIIFTPGTEHTVSVNGTQSEYEKKIRFDNIKDESARLEFINSLGYTVESSPCETVQVKIPSKMDAVLEKYNDLQKSQGFNLAKYKNKKVTRYTYRVTALPDAERLPEEDVLLTIIMYKDKIIGGDVYFSGADSVVVPLLK